MADWTQNRLVFTGPAERVMALRDAVAGVNIFGRQSILSPSRHASPICLLTAGLRHGQNGSAQGHRRISPGVATPMRPPVAPRRCVRDPAEPTE